MISKSNMDVNFIFLILWVFGTAVCISMKCNYFTFPTLTTLVFTVPENTTFSLPFVFYSTCGLPDHFRITVAKTLSRRAIVCQIVRHNGSCTVHAVDGASCKCLNQPGMYLLTKDAEEDDNTTWIWWRDSEKETGTELVFNITRKTFESSPGTPPGTDDDHEIQSESFQTHNVVIVVCIAGLAMLAIVAFIFMYAKAGRRALDIQARMRQEVIADAETDRPTNERRPASYIELIWDSRDQQHQPARRTVKWSRAAIPFVQENAEARPRSENIYHEIDEHPEDCDQPERGLHSNLQPSMDEDGYLAPKNLICPGAAKQL